MTAVAICLDWGRHRVNATPKPCRICGRPALMTDAKFLPCHKVCAEAEVVRHAERYGRSAG
jgi:hypothetical protein